MVSKESRTDVYIRNARTRVHACGIMETLWRNRHQLLSPRSRVCGVSLVATDQGSMRILLTDADRERARPREADTERWPTLIDFCCFRLPPECKLKAASGQWPKTAEIDQASTVQRVCAVDFYIFYTSTRPTHHSRTVLSPNVNRANDCFMSRSKSPCTLHAPGEAASVLKNHRTSISTMRKSRFVSGRTSVPPETGSAWPSSASRAAATVPSLRASLSPTSSFE